MTRPLCVMQVLPELDVGGVERGTIEIAQALIAAGQRAIVVSAGGRLVAELEQCGAEHITLGVGDKRLASLAHVRTLAKLYRDLGVDVVHARSRLPAWLAHLARRRLTGAERPRWVTTVHGPYSVNRYSRVMVSGDVVIAISEFIRNYITHNYPQVADERIRVVPRGVDTQRYIYGFRPDERWQAAWTEAHPHLHGKQLLTLPGRLTRWKGQLDFIKLVAELRRRGHNVHGLVVGGAHARKPHFENELRDAARVAGIATDISFLGNRADLREILAVSHCAYSLTRDPEAFGRTTIEALSLGTPVIGYDHGGTGEILAQVFPQGLIPLGDVAAAADCSARVLNGGVQVPRHHRYTASAMQQATLAIYARLCAP